MNRISISRAALAFGSALLLAGCGGGGAVDRFFSADSEPPAASQSPEDLFARAQSELNDGRPKTAAFHFDEIERLYPYAEVTKDAMLMSAVASFQAKEYDSAISAAERFVGFFPSDDQTAYARSIVAQSYYDQIVDVGRDQGLTIEARRALEQLIVRHPGSEFARDAQLRLETTVDQLAGKEMTVGRYYLKRGNYIGAINRFQTVVKEYDTTTHVEEALHRLVESNLALGLVEEAKAAGAVLGHNYPGGEWYADSYATLTGEGVISGDKDGWFSGIYRRVVKGQWL